jgi:hypothetical protein
VALTVVAGGALQSGVSARARLAVSPFQVELMRKVRPNPSIERTSQRLRLCAAAHVER